MTVELQRRDLLSRVIDSTPQESGHKRYFEKESGIFLPGQHREIVSGSQVDLVKSLGKREIYRLPFHEDEITRSNIMSRFTLRIRGIKSVWEILTEERLVWSPDSPAQPTPQAPQ